MGANRPNQKWDAFIYGDVNIDLVIPGVDHLPLPGQEDVVATMNTYVGGGAALFTLGLGKLGLNPVFQGTVGKDCYGDFILKEFEKSNIDTSLLEISDVEKTGISISFTNEKDRSFLTYRGTNAELDVEKVNLAQLQNAKHIHVTGYEGSRNHQKYCSLLQKVKETKNTTVSFDVGWDDSGEWYEGIVELFPYIDVLFMNETEAIHYGRKKTAEDAAKAFAESGAAVVIKLGAKGSLAYQAENQYQARPYRVKAVDTTGAGDSFNAGFIYGFLKQKNMQDCLRYANGCGALSVTQLGGNTGFPTEKELLQFIEEQEER